MRVPSGFFQVFGSFAICISAALNPLGSASERVKTLAVIGATAYPSPWAAPISDCVVLITDGRIAKVGKRGKVAVPRNAQVLDATGLVLLAGFWNSHVHFSRLEWENSTRIPSSRLSRQLEAMVTRYGFTTVFDTGSDWENTKAIRRRVESGEVAGPKVFSTGPILFPRGGAPPLDFLKRYQMFPSPMPEVDGPQQAVEVVRRELDAGVDAIKIYVATWRPPIVSMPLSVVRQITSEAHRHGKPVLAHPSNASGLEVAVDGGVDVLVHTAPNAGEWNAALLSKMKRANIALIPTLKLWEYETRDAPAADSRAFVDRGVEQLRAYSEAGDQILFGTDVGYMADFDPTEEYRLMSRAGMTFSSILASLTTAPAARFGKGHRMGLIAPGFDADLVLLAGDPAADVTRFADVKCTIRAGKVIYGSCPSR